jgi:hypothetical protein
MLCETSAGLVRHRLSVKHARVGRERDEQRASTRATFFQLGVNPGIPGRLRLREHCKKD